MKKCKNIMIIGSLIFIVVIIFIIFLFILNNNTHKSHKKDELISYGDIYYYIDSEDIYIYFFEDNTCVLNVNTESCIFEIVDNNKIILKMTAKENGNTSVARMYFDIINKSTINRTSFKIGTDYNTMEEVGNSGTFTTNRDEVKKNENLNNEKWHKQFNLGGSKEKPYATLKLLKGNECEIDFSLSSKSVKLDHHQYMSIEYNNGLCTYNKLNDLDFIIKYTGTFDIIHPVNELNSLGNYVFQTENHELKITFKDENYDSFKINNGEWDIINSAIYLKEKKSSDINSKTESSNNSNDSQNINKNEYIRYSIENDDTIKTISEKFDMDAQDILNYNNLKNESLSNITDIKIPTSKMFSKIDTEVYTNIENIINYDSLTPDGTCVEKSLKIYMKDGNEVVVNYNYLSIFKDYYKIKSSLEKENTGNWILYLNSNNPYVKYK